MLAKPGARHSPPLTLISVTVPPHAPDIDTIGGGEVGLDPHEAPISESARMMVLKGTAFNDGYSNLTSAGQHSRSAQHREADLVGIRHDVAIVPI